MNKKTTRSYVPFLVMGLSLAASMKTAPALNIVYDYSNETASDGFFAAYPMAQVALEKAAADLEAAITTQLNPAGDEVVGQSGSTSVWYNFFREYENPSTGARMTIADATMPADEFRLFVGMKELDGAVGVGGPGILRFSAGFGGLPSEWPAAAAATNMLATTMQSRGGGPTLANINFVSTWSGVPATLDVSYGSAVGSLSFDMDSNNDSLPDTAAEIEAYWHFDPNTPVPAGKTDFYTIALHEALHALGVGTARDWTAQTSGTDWLGASVAALQGSGTGTVAPGHIASGVSSPRLSDGVMQEPVSAPSFYVGSRKELTQLDLAFLRDINWDTAPVPVPEPSVPLALGLAGLAAFHRRKRVA